jgi:hypothetical protein
MEHHGRACCVVWLQAGYLEVASRSPSYVANANPSFDTLDFEVQHRRYGAREAAHHFTLANGERLAIPVTSGTPVRARSTPLGSVEGPQKRYLFGVSPSVLLFRTRSPRAPKSVGIT